MAPRNGKEILEFSHREKSATVYFLKSSDYSSTAGGGVSELCTYW